MTSPAPEALGRLAGDAAREAGAVLLGFTGRALDVQTKSSATDPVSEADRASERRLVQLLLAARPDDGLLGEEGAARTGSSGLRWVLDPLDGTVNFLYGLPGWCVSVACEDDEGPLAGAVYDPGRDELFCAWRDGPARCGDSVLAVNDPVGLAQALVATGFAYDARVRRRQGAALAGILPRIRDVRRVGSAALDLCWTAAGRYDGYYEDTCKPWDWAAGALIVRQAGGTVTPLGTGVVAAGPALHAELVEALSRAGPGDERSTG